MSNYPDYSSPKSKDSFQPYSRKQVSTSSAYESRLQHLYDDEDFYKYSSHTDRLQSPESYSQNQNSHLPRHGSLNNDSNIYRHPNRDRYDFQREPDLGGSQRYTDTKQSYQHPLSSYRNSRENLLRNGHAHPEDNTQDSFLFANHSQNRETYPDYSRSSFSRERDQPLDDYTRRKYLNQSGNSEIATFLQSKEDFASISKDVNSQLLAPDIPISNMSSLSKEEEILKEIKILQQQQKLQELLNVSLSIAKQIKHSPVLRDIDRESLSNNSSSSKPEIFSDQAESQPRFQNLSQIAFKSDGRKDGEIANSSSQSPSLDNLWPASNSNISHKKSGETELSSVNEQKCLSFSNFPSKLISGNQITTNVTSEVDRQWTKDSFDNKLLYEKLDISSMNNTVSEDSTSVSEWSKSHSIPFLGETANTLSTVNELGLSPGSQNIEQSATPSSGENQSNSNENKESVKSNLEDALETLQIMDPVVGLDFIIENKSSVAADGSFPFQCKLCNSSITRSLIIDHILGTKHRMRFVKTKDESLYNHIMSPLVIQTDKEEEIYKAAHKMEKKYGRGRVVIQDKGPTNVAKSSPGIKITFKKIENQTGPPALKLDNENYLEESDTRADANIKSEHSTSPDDIAKTSSKVPPSIVENPFSVSTSGNNTFEFSKQVSSNKFEINQISVNAEPSIITSPLKLNNKVTVESVLCSNANSNNDPSISLSLKRPATPSDDMLYKHIKTDEKSFKTEIESVDHDNSLCKDSELCKTTSSSTPIISSSIAAEYSLTNLLEHMSKWKISSAEEAEMVSKTVDVLLKLLLRYKLQQEAGNDIENVMKSFLSTYLEKTNKHSDSATSFNLPLNEKDSTLVMKANYSTTGSASESSPMEVVENKDTIQIDSSLPNMSNIQEASKCLSNTETASSISSDTPASGLQPPPFFCWTKPNTPPPSTAVSSSPAPTRAMSWSSPYGSNLGYYQQQGYGGIPSMYQSFTLPMTHCVSPVALSVPPVPLAPITPVSIVPPPPLPSVDRPPIQLSFVPPPPPPLANPPLPPPPPTENRPPPPSNELLPPLPPPLPSENRSADSSYKVLPPLPTCIPPPPPS